MAAKKITEKSNEKSSGKKKAEAKAEAPKAEKPAKDNKPKAAAAKSEPEPAPAAAEKKTDDNKAADKKPAEKAPAPAPEPVQAAKSDDDEPAREPLIPPDKIDTSIDPNTKAAPPTIAPQGDARSLRRQDDFCLIYRRKQYLVRREGKVGTMGKWSVTEYPSMEAAAHAYAQECSELTGAGFADLRG